MFTPKVFSIAIVFLVLFALSASNSVFAQNDEVEIEVPTAKNAIGVRPLSAVFGFYGISYERYVAKNYSIYGYIEISDGPKLFSSNVNTWLKGSMGVDNAKVYYAGYGAALGVRRYFADKKYSLVGNKDLGSLVGWFVGAYIPFRKMLINVETQSVERFAFFEQQDKGSYSFNGYIYGVGLEGGRHWVWDRFNFEVNLGFTYMQGLPNLAKFNYSRPAIGNYEVEKGLGLINVYGTFAPKFELVMGIAF
ncbi:MAG: hypothetical protein ACKVOU_00930 [Cytophagales bacterium]